MTATTEIHRFASGLCVSRARLLPVQIDRYTAPGASNLHEPEEEGWFEQVFARTGAEGCFVDVGAAIGYYSALVRKAKPGWQIHAMEPWAVMREGIAETFALNDLARNGLELDPRALSTSAGSSAFRTHAYGSSLLTGDSKTEDPVISVETIPMADLLAELGRPVTLMKMDIQGHEVEVLTAAAPALSRGGVEWLILGTHGAAKHKACLALLRDTFEIVHSDPSPPEQPDGLIVARFAGHA